MSRPRKPRMKSSVKRMTSIARDALVRMTKESTARQLRPVEMEQAREGGGFDSGRIGNQRNWKQLKMMYRNGEYIVEISQKTGNRTKRVTYTYDAEGKLRLKEIDKGKRTVIRYDPHGRLIGDDISETPG